MKDIDAILKVLNDAFDADPDAIRALILHRVPCNRALADHPTVQVNQDTDDLTFSVGAIGLLNGVVEKFTGKKVAILVDGVPVKILGFVEWKVDEAISAKVD